MQPRGQSSWGLGACFLAVAVTAFAAPEIPLEAKPLAAFPVAPEFILDAGLPPFPRDRGAVRFVSVDNLPPRSHRGRLKYRSVGLESGDEVVSVNGKPVAGLSSGQRFWSFYTQRLGQKIAVVVHQPGSTVLRTVTVVPVFHPEERFTDDATVRQLAEFYRPACVVDEHGKVVFDAGGGKYLEAIEVKGTLAESGEWLDRPPEKIVLRSRQRLEKPPLLTTVDAYQITVATRRGEDREWIYELKFGDEFTMATVKKIRFRIAIL